MTPASRALFLGTVTYCRVGVLLLLKFLHFQTKHPLEKLIIQKKPPMAVQCMYFRSVVTDTQADFSLTISFNMFWYKKCKLLWE